MSILQNFKDEDHRFEKKILFAILYLAVAVAIFILVIKAVDRMPHVKELIVTHGRTFRYFLLSSFGLIILSYYAYQATLDDWETETKMTIKVSVLFVVLWTIFWISWSIFCAWLTLTSGQQTNTVRIAILCLVTIPGFIAFLISKIFRRADMRQVESEKNSMRQDDPDFEKFNVSLNRKYYSGYYGLLCLPVYLLSVLVGNVF